VRMSQSQHISRKDATRVSLAYRYHNPSWDLTRNLAVYGENHSVDGVGGNLVVWLEVMANPTGPHALVVPEKSLNPVLAHLKSRLDHRCLFEVEPWFKSRVPTLENIALFLSEQIQIKNWYSLTVEENENWRVQIFRETLKPRLTYTRFIGFGQIEATVEGEIDSDSGLLMQRKMMEEALKRQPPKDLLQRLPGLVALRVTNPQRKAVEWLGAPERA
jgi:6-pyruvoyltetrahydropterin/6-carboxytetrahydropterin synthase